MRPLLMLFAGVSLAMTGCGGPMTITGTITVQGQPLERGSIMVESATGEVLVAPVEKGTFRLEGVPRGALKVAITESEASAGPASVPRADRNGNPAAARSAPTAKPSRVPPPYQTLETTPLRYTEAQSTLAVTIP